MMLSPFIAALTLAAVGLAAPDATAQGAVAQTAAAPRAISFEQAVQIALDQNLGLLLADNQRGLDRTAVSDARWRFFPDLRLSLSGGESFDKVPGSGWESGGKSLSAGLSSGVTLFDGFANVSGLREAHFEQVAGELDYERARQTVVFQVISDYLALIEATEQERVRLENLAAQEEQGDRVRALVEEGERPINERYQQDANVASARLSLVEARRSLALARVDLMQTLHLDPFADITFVIPEPGDLNPQANRLDAVGSEDRAGYAALMEAAIQARPDLAAERERLAATEERLNQAYADRWPTLSLSGNLSTRYSDGESGSVLDQFDDRQSAGIGLSLSYPLFTRMQTRNAIRRSHIGLENANINMAALNQDVALQVRRAVLDRDAAQESLEAATARVAAARESLAYTNERYLAGASTLYEVTLARADFVSAESGEVSARYRLLWQNRLVEYYVGTLDPEAGLSP